MEHLAKPFLKWAGGKSKLLPVIEPLIPSHIDHYVEPFLGGGAMLLHILQSHPELISSTANDINHRLITTYIAVQQQPENLLEELSCLKKEYIMQTDHNVRTAYYLKQRDRFNSLKDISPNQQDYNSYIVELGALFIFLNHTCFNGLYRENKKGEFNVPHGKYLNPSIFDEDNILAVSKLIQHTNFTYNSYKEVLSAKPNHQDINFYYLDPPYRPITDTSFTTYTQEGFSDTDQLNLASLIRYIDNHGAYFILSNSFSQDNFFQTLYKNFSIKEIEAPRPISSKPSTRKNTKELLIYNPLA